jgi:nucleotide-binding universal stress UspA family protein
MFKRILIATDGSKLSRKAITNGIAVARAVDAEVVGFYARAPFPMVYAGEAIMLPASTEREYELDTIRLAKKYLAEIQTAAEAANLGVKTVHVMDQSPAEAIMRAAKKHKCDLIVMASHGRRGFARVLLGSETNHVLTHSKIPVLVTR